MRLGATREAMLLGGLDRALSIHPPTAVRPEPVEGRPPNTALETRPSTSLRTNADGGAYRGVAEAYEALVARRAAGEPLAYITGTRAFWTIDLAVAPGVLIPAP